MTRCPTCAMELPDGSRFCLACGAALGHSYTPTLVQTHGQTPARNRLAATMSKRFGYTEATRERVYGFSRNDNYCAT